jgi:hypothetical protein
MTRRTRVGLAMAALITLAAAIPGVGLAPRAAAASCSGWTSETDPPPTIRVFRHESGEVDTVNFKPYAKNVLSREWISSWTTASLRAGALAVKSYAWYQVLHWRGGQNEDGECFDIRDDTQDQVYDPDLPTYATAAAAVDATWLTRVLQDGAIFPTYYNAGDRDEPCGANANGWRMYQWGTQTCGLDGLNAVEIVLTYYYPGVTVTDAPPEPSPSPSPTQTPAPTAEPSASPDPSRTPRPSATPERTPEPTPEATPPPDDDQEPGGGQSTVIDAPAPPTPPPDNPAPVVVAAPQPEQVSRPVWSVAPSRAFMRHWLPAVMSHRRPPRTDGPPVDPRLIAFRISWAEAWEDLVRALQSDLRVMASRPDVARSQPGSH